VASRVSSQRFIGRRSELDRLHAALAKSQSRDPQFLVIGGEAGVGKSRLIQAAGQRQTGHTLLVGGCLNVSEGAAPLAPFVEAVRTLAGSLPPAELDEILGPAREAVGLILPAATGGDGHEEAWHPSAQGQLFEHLLGIFTRLSHRAPALVVIEDIHWADRSTLDLLRFLVRNLRDAALVLVATFRTDEPSGSNPLRSFLAELERSGRVDRIDLRRFNRAELADQIHGILGSPASSALVDRIYRL
jgi:predicted ATPase